MKTNIITQSQLHKTLGYDPETGVFIWLSSRKGIQKGRVAGCLHVGESGYRHIFIRIDRKLYKAHRLAWLYMKGKWPLGEIDHKDHDATNNRLSNLREVTHLQNQQNMSKPSDNTSGVMGVCWHKTYSKWNARIKVNGKYLFLGAFKDYFEAVCARKSAENKHGFHENHGN